MQSFTVPSAIYAMRLPCAEYARAKEPGYTVRLDKLVPSIEVAPDGWYYCGCGNHRFAWEGPVAPEAEGWAV